MTDINEMAAPEKKRQELVARLVLFAAAFMLWLALDWPVSADGSLIGGNIAAGLVAAAVVALVMRDLVTQRLGRLIDPVRYFWAAVYLVVFAFYTLMAGFDVMYRVLHPAMPIKPGIVKVQTRLRSDSARTVLANSITLTPGTLTIDVTENGILYVHWINVATEDEKAATAQILGPFEWFIGKIFE